MSELAKQQSRSVLEVDINQGAILKHLGLNADDPAAQALVLTCQRYGLDPILKHALLIQGRLYVTRDGLLHVAHRSQRLDGIEVLEQGENASHYLARVAVYRKDMSKPFVYVGRYPKQGSNKNYGPEMAVKCAEVMALRRAFDVSLAAREEMWDQDEIVSHTDVKASVEAESEHSPSSSVGADAAGGEVGGGTTQQATLGGEAGAGPVLPSEETLALVDQIDQAITGGIVKFEDVQRKASDLALRNETPIPEGGIDKDSIAQLGSVVLKALVVDLKLEERMGAKA